jgi:hypothetical protein
MVDFGSTVIHHLMKLPHAHLRLLDGEFWYAHAVLARKNQETPRCFREALKYHGSFVSFVSNRDHNNKLFLIVTVSHYFYVLVKADLWGY